MHTNKDVIPHLALVAKIARRVCRRLPDYIDIEDLIQAGYFGLLEALTRFDASKGASFENFAQKRIKGSMIDFVRSKDYLSRDYRRMVTQIKKAVNKLEIALKRHPSEQELATYLTWTLDKLRQVTRDTNIISCNSETGIMSVLADHQKLTPEGQLSALQELARARARIQEVLADQPPKYKLVYDMYFIQELKLAQIGKILHLNESRICQIKRHIEELLYEQF